MSFDAQRLYELLPAVHRIRDSEQGEPLKELLTVIADQVAVLEENIEQLYDDQFIETCADWVVPYIGDLVGYRPLHAVAPKISSPRAEVANTIAFRRRKGTASMLEQLARDVTGWPARVVEFFQLLATTQFMNHLRPGNRTTPDLRLWEPLQRLNTAFDTIAHTADVRSIARRRGKHNIPNVGIFLWRLKAYSSTRSPAFKRDDRRFLFSPLGHDIPLFTAPEAEDEITYLAEPINVPMPISRRVLREYQPRYYGDGKSLLLRVDGQPKEVVICNLADVTPGGEWAHMPTGETCAIDPVLGRIALPDLPQPATSVEVSYHYGFSADMGGGEYERSATFDATLDDESTEAVPSPHGNIEDAITALEQEDGVVEITDNDRHTAPASIDLAAGQHVELRGRNERRPVVDLSASGTLSLSGDSESQVTLNGLLIVGGALQVPEGTGLQRIVLRHCTLVPGLSLLPNGDPEHAGRPSLIVDAADVTVEIDRSIVGPLQVAPGSHVVMTDSILDATDQTLVAYSGPPDDEAAGELAAGGKLIMESCTVIGRMRTVEIEMVSNCILLARNPQDDQGAPIHSQRKQRGCVRFSYVPPEAQVPRRFRCQPDLAIQTATKKAVAAKGGELTNAETQQISARVATRVRPSFTDLRYGTPAYAQLARGCPAEIRTGAEDESEMGAFRHLFQPQREANLRTRLNEYLRFGLEAGIFYET